VWKSFSSAKSISIGSGPGLMPRGVAYTADPRGLRPIKPGAVNGDGSGGRLYFHGPDDHMLEVLTARYSDVPKGPASIGRWVGCR